MKKTLLITTTFLFILTVIYSGLQLNKHEETHSVEKPNEWFYMQRAFPHETINHEAYLNALNTAKQMKTEAKSARASGVWEFAGPVNTGGRLTDVEMHHSDLNTIYLGAASGGVFKSNDQGENWEPIFDDALSLSIGDIAIAPSDAEIIYVGTGEANAGGGSLAYDGVGIYKSEDAGSSWKNIGLPNSGSIGRIAIHPSNPDVAYVAAMGSLFDNSNDRGVYRTTNGGFGWNKVLYVSDSTGAIDLAINPESPDTVYAAMWERIRRPNRRSYGGPTSGIYRSIDGGQNWEELTNGLPTNASAKGRIGISISESDPNIVYAIYADQTGFFNGVYKTTDHGDTWTQTNDNSLSGAYSSFGWWFGRIKVDPVDPDIAFVIGLDIYRTLNGGQSWSNQSGNNVHVDQHEVYIHPQDNDFVLLGNDGGLYTSVNGGNSWVHDETLPITQFYTCELDNQIPWRLYGGTQDNGTNRIIFHPDGYWERIYGGDGFYVLVDPKDNNYIYAESQYGGLGRSTNGGESFYTATNGISSSDRFNWNSPLAMDPENPEVLYFGSNRLYRSTNRAASWTPISYDMTDGSGEGNLVYNTLTTISVSPVNTDIIYTGSDDGNINVSIDGGNTWENISEGLPKRWITRVAADPLEENVAYVTVSGYRWDEYIPHVLRTDNYGQTWVDISSNLPEAPVNDIIISPGNNLVIFLATDVGVYYSYDGGESWDVMGTNLPNVVITDLVYHQSTNKLVAATFGRSMFSYDLEQDVQTEITEESTSIEISIFPNPFSEYVTIWVSDIEKTVQVTIYDMNGRKISSFTGSNEVIWDGTNEEGIKCRKGSYICTVSNGHQSFSKLLVLQ